MAEKPIIFSGAGVRAILDGRKTQTRRIVKGVAASDAVRWGLQGWETTHGRLLRQRYRVDDLLWVREVWHLWGPPEFQQVSYRATWPDPDDMRLRWRTPIYMPRWASRVTLRVTNVRVQRVRDITEEDAVAEGAAPHCKYGGRCNSNRCTNNHYRQGFARLWDEINDKRGYGWRDNPWVWAIGFDVVEVR